MDKGVGRRKRNGKLQGHGVQTVKEKNFLRIWNLDKRVVL